MLKLGSSSSLFLQLSSSTTWTERVMHSSFPCDFVIFRFTSFSGIVMQSCWCREWTFFLYYFITSRTRARITRKKSYRAIWCCNQLLVSNVDCKWWRVTMSGELNEFALCQLQRIHDSTGRKSGVRWKKVKSGAYALRRCAFTFFVSFSFYDSLICCLLLNIPHIPRLHNQPYDKRDLLFYGRILPKSQWDQMFSSSPLYSSRILSCVDVTIKLRLLNQETLLHFYRQTKWFGCDFIWCKVWKFPHQTNLNINSRQYYLEAIVRQLPAAAWETSVLLLSCCHEHKHIVSIITFYLCLIKRCLRCKLSRNQIDKNDISQWKNQSQSQTRHNFIRLAIAICE